MARRDNTSHMNKLMPFHSQGRRQPDRFMALAGSEFPQVFRVAANDNAPGAAAPARVPTKQDFFTPV